MNPYLPFKQTPQSDFFTQFRQYMLSVYPPESNFASISPFFKEINQLRASLDYSKYQKLIQADSRLSEELEKFLLKYLSMCLLLDKNLKFSRAGLPNSSDRTQMSLNITWQDSLSNTLSSDSSMKFEIINSLYNLAICEIYSGISFLQSFESDDQKQAIKRFRIGLWALKEVKILIANVNAKFSDLSLAHLNLLENLFLGLAYLTLYEFNEKKEISLGYANMASMLMTASKHFQTADMILEQNKNLYPKELFNKLCLMMLFYESYTEGLAGLKMSKHHENLLQDEPKIQHMGYALAYILQGLKKIERINSKDFISNLPGHYQQKLKILREDALKTSKTFENKNNQIYKHKVFPDNELPGPPEADKPIIGPIIPDLFLKPMEEEQFFQNLLSEEIEAENFEIRKIAEE